MPTTAVIGASRGIGLALLDELSKTDGQVIGTIRGTPPTSPPPNTKYLTLDVTSEASVSAAASQVTDGIDTLIVNAAMGDDEKLLKISDKSLTQYLDVNVVGPHRVIKAFLPALRKGKEKKIIVISSGSGSCAIQVEHIHGFSGPYSVSKAALNMLAIQIHTELKDEGFTVIALHPGWVATDMGSKAGSGGMDPKVSAEKCLGVIQGLGRKDSPGFFSYEGKTMPW